MKHPVLSNQLHHATPGLGIALVTFSETRDRERARDTWRRSNGRRKNFIAVEAELAAAKKASTNKESGKSSILLDVKPWDDESDMKKLDEAVRSVEMEGLF
ncbi:hypothetical protein PS2_003272 [Malus domestica]